MKEQELENNFENKLRRKAEDFRMKPSEKVWVDIKDSLGQRKRKRRFLWLWAAAAGLLLGTGLTSLYFTQKAATQNAPIANAVEIMENEKNNSANVAGEERYSKQATNEKDTPAIETHLAETGASGLAGSGQIKSNSSSQYTNGDAMTSVHAATIETAAITGKPGGNNVGQTGSTEGSLWHDDLSREQPATTQIIQLPSFTIANPYTDNSLAALQDFSAAQSDMLFKASRFSIGGQIIPLVSKMNYGPLNTESVLNTADQAFADSIEKLNRSSGTPLIGFSTGMDVRYDLSEKFSVGAGIYFTRTGEKNALLKAGSSPAFAADTVTVGTSSNPPVTIAFTGTIESITRFNWLDFNLLGEWYFFRNENVKISLAGGGGISHFLNYEYSESGNEPASIRNSSLFSNDQQPPVFHVYQLTALTGIHYRYSVSKHFSVLAGAQFHYYITSITLSDIPVTAHPYWFGINAGINYHF